MFGLSEFMLSYLMEEDNSLVLLRCHLIFFVLFGLPLLRDAIIALLMSFDVIVLFNTGDMLCELLDLDRLDYCFLMQSSGTLSSPGPGPRAMEIC